MYRLFANGGRFRSTTCLLVLLVFTYRSSFSQDKTRTKTAGVDDSAMGAYRALAQLSFQAFQKGDNTTAAELARVLERTWDQGEQDLHKRSPQAWIWIDESMDRYVKPLMRYGEKAPDPIVVEAAYNEYLVELKLAD